VAELSGLAKPTKIYVNVEFNIIIEGDMRIF
jgi:hypothetical protein